MSTEWLGILLLAVLFAAIFIVINLATDLLGQWLDPRTREQTAA